MALLNAFGFDDCSVVGDLGILGFISPSGMAFSSTGGKFAGGAMSFATAGDTIGYTALKNPIGNSGNRGVGFYARITTSTGVIHLGVGTTNSTAFRVLSISASAITILNSSAVVASIPSSIMTNLGYHWIEYTIVGSDCVVFIDDLEVLRTPASGVIMPNTILTVGASNNAMFDDIVTWNGVGSYFNTFPIHPQRIAMISPSAAGDSTQWTPTGTANNWQAVNKTTYTGSLTQYNTAPSSPLKDLYQFTDLPYTPWKINALQSKIFAQENGSVSSNVTLKAKLSVTELDIGAVALPVGSNAVLWAISYLNPLGSAWTAADVNDAQFGFSS